MNLPLVDHPFQATRVEAADEFRPDWDVATIGNAASAALIDDLNTARANPRPSGNRRIHLLLGPSGYGKTHLFGRVLHAQGDRVQFVYVPMTADPAHVPPVEHVRWKLVETLFNAADGPHSPLHDT